MTYYYFCLFFLLIFCLAFVIEVSKDFIKDEFCIKKITLCLLLAILYKYNWGIEFWGLEYEDAYVFSFCARQFSHGIYPCSFLVDAVSIGSLDEPISISTYGGHFITYPTFLSIFTRLFGWSPYTISLINVLIAFLIMLVLTLMSKNSKYWMVAPLIYCMAPALNVFATCFLAEIFSSFICVTFIYTFFRFPTKSNLLLRWLAFFVALLCKRENLLLLIVPLIDDIYKWGKTIFANKKSALLRYVPYLCLTIIYFSLIQNVFEIEKIEAKDIGHSTFSVNYFLQSFPVFIKSLLSWRNFGIATTSGVFLIVIKYIKFKQERKVITLCLTLGVLYLILYSSHYRGYFFVHNYESFSDFMTFRYINNFFYLIPVATIWFVAPPRKIITTIICSFLLCLSLYLTISERLYYSNIEDEARLGEAIEVRDYIEKTNDKKTMLICDDILVYQNICKDNFSVCDTRYLPCIDLDDREYTYYCVSPDLNYMKERYGVSIPMSRFKARKTLVNGKILYVYQ